MLNKKIKIKVFHPTQKQVYRLQPYKLANINTYKFTSTQKNVLTTYFDPT